MKASEAIDLRGIIASANCSKPASARPLIEAEIREKLSDAQAAIVEGWTVGVRTIPQEGVHGAGIDVHDVPCSTPGAEGGS
jgi:hypothetical protein